MSANIKLPGHRISHDRAGDICRYLRNGALQFIQHGLHCLYQGSILKGQEKKLQSLRNSINIREMLKIIILKDI